MEDPTERLESLEDRAAEYKTRKSMLEEREQTLSDAVQHHEQEIAVLSKVEELFRHLLDKLVYRYAQSFSEITTEGLQKIFTDQDLGFRIDVEERYGKVSLDFVTTEGDLEGDALESFGGGPASVQSLILRILVVLRADLAKYLFLDEALASLSEAYIPKCGQFIQQMCERMGVDILLITHNRSFLDYADTAYQAALDDDGWLTVEEISGGEA